MRKQMRVLETSGSRGYATMLGMAALLVVLTTFTTICLTQADGAIRSGALAVADMQARAAAEGVAFRLSQDGKGPTLPVTLGNVVVTTAGSGATLELKASVVSDSSQPNARVVLERRYRVRKNPSGLVAIQEVRP